ncbi:DUF4012 domain-containing protein [Streptomyces sp. NPDC127084]|uniref:DUF4012 domain-containing protein n=1 Tax=Streptomyces sp. NPDC127084 TaxID=3347133 RepID=UPI00364B8969
MVPRRIQEALSSLRDPLTRRLGNPGARWVGLLRRVRGPRHAGSWLLAFAGLLLSAAAWLAGTGLYARGELLAARHDLEAVRSALTGAGGTGLPGGRPEPGKHGERAEEAAASAAAHTANAHSATTGPVWYLAAGLPFAGEPLETIRGTAKAFDRLAGDVLPSVVRTLGRVSGHSGTGHLDLSALRGSAPALERAAHHMAQARTETHRLPRRTWLPAVDRVRSALADRLDRLAPVVADAATGARLLPPMLGDAAPRRYLLVFQNPAEARGTGGMPGAYTMLTATRGRLSLTEFGIDTTMAGARPKVALGPEFNALYGSADPVNSWPNSNMSPHFPYAARIWSATWFEKSGGERIDGVFAVDPAVLARLLVATGPAAMADGTVVSADNIVDLSERTNYEKFSDSVKRKAYLLDVARAAADRLLSAADDPRRRPALFLAVYDVLRSGRMTAWSAHADEQRQLERYPFGGALPRNDRPYAGLVVNNGAGTKLDYYLDRALEWRPGRCTAEGREVTVKAVLSNSAPLKGLPPYVTARLDKPAYPVRLGDNRLLVSYYATSGAELLGASVDGRRVMLNQGAERGHPVYTFDVELPSGGSRTLAMRLREPVSEQRPVVFQQRLPRPMKTTVHPYPSCSDG